MGWVRSPVHSYTAMARVTGVVEEGWSVWAWRGESGSAEIRKRAPMKGRRCMLAMLDEVGAKNFMGIAMTKFFECARRHSRGRVSDEIIDATRSPWDGDEAN